MAWKKESDGGVAKGAETKENADYFFIGGNKSDFSDCEYLELGTKFGSLIKQFAGIGGANFDRFGIKIYFIVYFFDGEQIQRNNSHAISLDLFSSLSLSVQSNLPFFNCDFSEKDLDPYNISIYDSCFFEEKSFINALLENDILLFSNISHVTGQPDEFGATGTTDILFGEIDSLNLSGMNQIKEGGYLLVVDYSNDDYGSGKSINVDINADNVFFYDSNSSKSIFTPISYPKMKREILAYPNRLRLDPSNTCATTYPFAPCVIPHANDVDPPMGYTGKDMKIHAPVIRGYVE